MSSIPVIAFFNNKGGVGKTSLVYHLAWMFADLGLSVVAADLDPQANLTSAFLSDERLEIIIGDHQSCLTIYDGFRPLKEGIGDIAAVHIEDLSASLGLLAGDLRLSELEDELSDAWTKCLDGDVRSFRVMSAFWRIVQTAGQQREARLILMDLGPNLGAINRASLIGADHIVIPLAPDLFSLQGLKNLGPTLQAWRVGWEDRLNRKKPLEFALPAGKMAPLGYIVLQHSVRLDRPTKAYDAWMNRIPETYETFVLRQPQALTVELAKDPNRITQLKHYRSLMPLAQEANKPMFHLKPGDGAIGAHYTAAQEARRDFEKLARDIARRAKIALPQVKRTLRDFLEANGLSPCQLCRRSAAKPAKAENQPTPEPATRAQSLRPAKSNFCRNRADRPANPETAAPLRWRNSAGRAARNL